MTSLEEAVLEGEGTERPFRCPSHDDSQASASVNVLLGVWYCHACHAKGTVDDKVIPTVEQLESMLQPEKAPRIYPEVYLDLFEGEGHWSDRFPPWLRWYARLGNDPFTGAATFPVRTPAGLLAGVGRRRADEEPRYKYPYGWSASTNLGGLDLVPKTPMVVLTEGYADAVSLWEVGVPALPTWGAGLHLPQREMLRRRAPDVVVLGFDNDKAGWAATERTRDLLAADYDQIVAVEWNAKDPASIDPDSRRGALAYVLGGGYLPAWDAWAAAMRAQWPHHEETDDDH